MNGIKGKLILLLTELLIPLLGYFLWNWDFIFIMLFFVLDWFVVILFNFVKIRDYLKIGLNGNSNQFAVRASILFLLSFLATLTLTIYTFNIAIANFDILASVSKFIHYKDTGIEQGYLLLPICLLSGYMIYKRDFLLPQLIQIKTIQEVFKNSVIIHLLIPTFTSIVCVFTILFHLPAEVLLYISLGLLIMGKVYFQIVKSES